MHVHRFKSTVDPSSDGYIQQDNTPCHKAQIILNCFLNRTLSSLYSNGFRLPYLNSIELVWDVVELELHIMDENWTKIHIELMQF